MTAPLLLAVRVAKAQIEAVAHSLSGQIFSFTDPASADTYASAAPVSTHLVGVPAFTGPATPSPGRLSWGDGAFGGGAARDSGSAATEGATAITITHCAAEAACEGAAGGGSGQAGWVGEGGEGGDTSAARLAAAAPAARREREVLEEKIRRAQLAVGRSC
jgi:hypothetical protein